MYTQGRNPFVKIAAFMGPKEEDESTQGKNPFTCRFLRIEMDISRYASPCDVTRAKLLPMPLLWAAGEEKQIKAETTTMLQVTPVRLGLNKLG